MKGKQMKYNDVIAKLYEVEGKLLNQNDINEAARLGSLLMAVDHIADPSREVVDKLNKIYKTYNERVTK